MYNLYRDHAPDVWGKTASWFGGTMPKKQQAPLEIAVLKGKTERWLITHWLEGKDHLPRVSAGLQYLDNKVMPPTYKFKPGGFAGTKSEILELADALKQAAESLPEPPEEEE